MRIDLVQHRTPRPVRPHTRPLSFRPSHRCPFGRARPARPGHLVAAYTTEGAHLNFTDPDLRGCRAAHYGANYPRLVAVKHRHDPDGLFTVPQPVDS
ncbi:BBE domain-containing protein [Kitasatospora griseola]|uniref:BBE domain-containing protein n=1 Tax=Kitasatospora griseola TaxID=2064 RepID=UPI00366033BA